MIQHLTDLQVQLVRQEWDGNANLYLTLKRWAVVAEAGGRWRPTAEELKNLSTAEPEETGELRIQLKKK